VNDPVKVPLVVFVPRVVVGLVAVLQQIPLTVTADPPFEVMLPPQVAVVAVIAEIAVVDRVGTAIASVLNSKVFP
jgi:hypothetical protein